MATDSKSGSATPDTKTAQLNVEAPEFIPKPSEDPIAVPHEEGDKAMPTNGEAALEKILAGETNLNVESEKRDETQAKPIQIPTNNESKEHRPDENVPSIIEESMVTNAPVENSPKPTRDTPLDPTRVPSGPKKEREMSNARSIDSYDPDRSTRARHVSSSDRWSGADRSRDTRAARSREVSQDRSKPSTPRDDRPRHDNSASFRGSRSEITSDPPSLAKNDRGSNRHRDDRHTNRQISSTSQRDRDYERDRDRDRDRDRLRDADRNRAARGERDIRSGKYPDEESGSGTRRVSSRKHDLDDTSYRPRDRRPDAHSKLDSYVPSPESPAPPLAPASSDRNSRATINRSLRERIDEESSNKRRRTDGRR